MILILHLRNRFLTVMSPPMNRDQLVQALRQDWKANSDVRSILAYLQMVDIHTIKTCSLWSNLFTFIMSGPI